LGRCAASSPPIGLVLVRRMDDGSVRGERGFFWLSTIHTWLYVKMVSVCVVGSIWLLLWVLVMLLVLLPLLLLLRVRAQMRVAVLRECFVDARVVLGSRSLLPRRRSRSLLPRRRFLGQVLRTMIVMLHADVESMCLRDMLRAVVRVSVEHAVSVVPCLCFPACAWCAGCVFGIAFHMVGRAAGVGQQCCS
jgi:hypothetical protein